MEPQAQQTLFGQTPFFQTFSPQELEDVLRVAEVVEIDAGRSIITEGRSDRVLYFLLRGRARVYNSLRPEITLGVFHPGMMFGEIAFFRGTRRTANVVAEEYSTLLRLTPEGFRGLPAASREKFHENIILLLIDRVLPLNDAIKYLHAMHQDTLTPHYFDGRLKRWMGDV
ncbi:MAG: cyclic nucleotide-binding domain-containing protein [Magnetococcus sp. WYHC-3]